MQFKKDQKAGLLLHHIQNISQSNGKDRTYLKEFWLSQSERRQLLQKKKKHLLHTQRKEDLTPCIRTAVKYTLY